MADAIVERRPVARFFCHRCNIEFEDVLQDYTCPYCASGFIEQLENDTEGGLSVDDFSDADMSNIEDMSNIDDMSNLDDSDDLHQSAPPMLNDLAFLMSGGRMRGPGRRETLMEQLVWMIGGARGGTGAVAAAAPFVLVGAPGDYVFGGEGLDAVVTQLLGQLENSGPPPLPREQIAALPTQAITEEQVAASTACSVCWENFQLGDGVAAGVRARVPRVVHHAVAAAARDVPHLPPLAAAGGAPAARAATGAARPAARSAARAPARSQLRPADGPALCDARRACHHGCARARSLDVRTRVGADPDGGGPAAGGPALGGVVGVVVGVVCVAAVVGDGGHGRHRRHGRHGRRPVGPAALRLHHHHQLQRLPQLQRRQRPPLQHGYRLRLITIRPCADRDDSPEGTLPATLY